MGKMKWEEELKKIEKRAVAEHDRLHKLFKENRFAFEIERKRMIEGVINSANNEDQKKRLRSMQDNWDKKMKSAGSKTNRFVLAQHIFWEHVENIWNPSIQEYSKELTSLVNRKGESAV